MKKSTTGLLILLFCVFGIIGISQQTTLKAPEPLYAVLGIGAAAGIFLMIGGRRSTRAQRTESKSDQKERAGGRKAVSKDTPVYIVRLPKAEAYATPSVCCSCLQPTERVWPISEWQGLTRRSMSFRCCQTCAKEKYPWWTYSAPVSFTYDARSGQMIFAFHHRQYAADFARMNGGNPP